MEDDEYEEEIIESEKGEQQLSERNGTLGHLERQIAAKERQITAKERQITAKEGQIAAKQQTMEEKEMRILHLAYKIKNLKLGETMELKQLERQIQRLDADLQRLNDDLQSLKVLQLPLLQQYYAPRPHNCASSPEGNKI